MFTDRIRYHLAASSRAALNASGVRPAAIYSALAELCRRYDVSPVALTQYELKVFSQNGEDGVLQEILRRIGVGSGSFVEFGIGDGSEGNCVFLAQVLGWQGVFLEGDPSAYERLQSRYAWTDRVATINAKLTPQTIEAVLTRGGADREPDVMSIDVDGNDFYLWQALETYRPRVVVIEYNARLDPAKTLVQPYADEGADGSDFFGASLGALGQLATGKGYRLVHTELAGVNAFFVRADLAAKRFPVESDVPRRAPNYLLDDVTMHRPGVPAREYLTSVDQ